MMYATVGIPVAECKGNVDGFLRIGKIKMERIQMLTNKVEFRKVAISPNIENVIDISVPESNVVGEDRVLEQF